MSETTAAATVPEKEGSLKSFLLASVLWLPLAFFFWFMFRSAVVAAPLRLATTVVQAWVPGLFMDIAQQFHELSYSIVADASGVPGLPAPRFAVELQTVNVL